MPEVSRFYGIVIAIYHNDHPPAHFHIRYAGRKAKMSIETLEVLDGSVPARVLALVIEWASQHRAALRQDWELAVAQKPLNPIPPLE